MSKRAKLALLALLGFSTACSTVRQSPEAEGSATGEGVEQSEPSIRVLYGVRPPVREVPQEQPAEQPAENNQQ